MAEAIQSGAWRKEFIKLLVVLAVAFSGWFIPAPAPMTEIGMRTITVFLSMVVGWSLTGDAWPSFLGLILFPLTGAVTLSEFLISGWGGTTCLFMILTFALIGYMNSSGLSRFLVDWLLTRKFIVGHPWRLIFMILFAAYTVCSLVNNMIGLFLMWEIVYGITGVINQKPQDKFPAIMVFGIAMQCAFSLVTVPWGMNAIANLGIYAQVFGSPANSLQYVSFTIPFGIMEILAYMLLVKFIFRLDVKPLAAVKPEDIAPDGVKMTPQIKHALILLGAFVVMLIGPSLLPADSEAAKLYNVYGSTGVVILFFIIISLLYYKNERVFVFAAHAQKEVPWNMVIMVAVILAIGATLMNAKTGIQPFLAQTIVPMLTSVPPWAFIIVLVVIETILTNFLINMVVVALLIPVVVPICPQLGLDPVIISFTIMLVSTNAILTPAGCAAASLLFPNKKWITTAQIYKYGVPTVCLNMVLLVLFYFAYALVM